MKSFLGSYVHQLDAKGRVSLPAQFRRGRESDSFVLIQAHSDALTLYPPEAWKRVEEKLIEMVQRRPETRHYLLGLTAQAHDVSPDKQGRILVPERLREAVGLGSEALIVGAIDKIELWDPARFSKSTEAERRNTELEKIGASIFA